MTFLLAEYLLCACTLDYSSDEGFEVIEFGDDADETSDL